MCFIKYHLILSQCHMFLKMDDPMIQSPFSNASRLPCAVAGREISWRTWGISGFARRVEPSYPINHWYVLYIMKICVYTLSTILIFIDCIYIRVYLFLYLCIHYICIVFSFTMYICYIYTCMIIVYDIYIYIYLCVYIYMLHV